GVLLPSGARPEEAVRRGAIAVDGWVMSPALFERSTQRLTEWLSRFHQEHPLRPGQEIGDARTFLVETGLTEPALAEALLTHLVGDGSIVRESTAVRLPEHRASTRGREDADRLVAAVRQAEPPPPSATD